MSAIHPRHPLGTRARVLLSSCFGPFAQDDEFGSRACNPMELYHNQVTRVQGGFSLRLHHRSFGLLLLQANVEAPCTVLDFPTRQGFVDELKRQRYDVIGIGAIIPNVGKVQEMCRLARLHQPGAQIVVGGHVANLPDLERRLDADHIVRGEGVRWLQTYLGQDPDAPVQHPAALSAFGLRALGLQPKDGKGDTAAILVPSVGCPVGCNFCATSAMFGGKGGGIHFYETGDALYDVMCGLEKRLETQSFFVLDENFLLHRKRALRLLDLMERDGKAWSMMVFSSARVLQSYGIERLVRLGVSWVWMGLEGEDSQYHKLRGIDTKALVKELQAHGIRVLGSTIIGMEHHTADNLPGVIDHAVAHATDFHQFMLYTPIPGTALHRELGGQGRLLPESECSLADSHGQARFNYRHPHLQPGSEGAWLLHAFRRDFQVNGPSLGRLYRTTLNGYLRYRNHPDARIRQRWQREGKELATTNAGVLWAARQSVECGSPAWHVFDEALGELYAAFGWRARVAATAIGRVADVARRLEDLRLQRGFTWEPATFREPNAAARALEALDLVRTMPEPVPLVPTVDPAVA